MAQDGMSLEDNIFDLLKAAKKLEVDGNNTIEAATKVCRYNQKPDIPITGCQSKHKITDTQGLVPPFFFVSTMRLSI